MSTRRPLANVPNVANSPRRGPLLASKRAYPGNPLAEGGYYQEPPLKKQLLDHGDSNARSQYQKPTSQAQDSKLFARKNNAPTSAFEKKLAAARDKGAQSVQSSFKSVKDVKASGGGVTADIEGIRMWQKYYRKVFPTFVFYFESIPDDVRAKCSRQIAALGAREEKFFSKEATHVVTTRPIPAEVEAVQRAGTSQESQSFRQQKTNGPVETVNPSLLDRTMLRGRPERQEASASQDVLYRARKMNMKIWSLDKLQRVVSTINDSEIGLLHAQNARNGTTSHARGRAENDLSMALRNEKLHGYSERDTFRDIISFKGPFIYVHDTEEKTRPVMVREYPKVARRQDGIWPQFRSSRLGKCPFLIDDELKKDSREKKKPAPKPKPAAVPLAPPPKPQVKPQVYEDSVSESESELSELGYQPEPVPEKAAKLPVRPFSAGKNAEPHRFPILNPAHAFRNDWPREPAASGVQPSNITSAIRSQMVSSAPGVPGAKGGTSKEVHELKRKVLEKSNGIVSMGGGSANYGQRDASMADRQIRAPVSRAAKTKAQGSVAPVREEIKTQRTTAKPRQGATRKPTNLKKAPKRDPKPGYCENCREKFDDFDQHTATRKHRKFAFNPDNWAELDGLLDLLSRPINLRYNGIPLDAREGGM